MRGLQSARRRDLRMLSGERVSRAVARFQRARACQTLPDWLARGFCAGVILDLIALAASVMRGFVLDRDWLFAPPLILAALAAFVAALRRASPEQVAREVDARLGLAERVATALEIERGQIDGPLAAVQRVDTLSQIRRFEPHDVFPLRLSRREGASAVVALVLLFASSFLPRFAADAVPAPMTGEIARAEAERLSALADELQADEDLPAEEKQALGQALTQVAERVEQQADAPEQAIAALSETERALVGQENVNAADRELALARLADALAQTKVGQEAARLLDRRNYVGAGRELRRLGEQAAQRSRDERLALAEAMQRAAQMSSRLDPSLSERLAEAAPALDGEQSAEAMARVADEVRQAGQEVTTERARERALAALQDARRAIGQGERADAYAQQQRGSQTSAAGGASGDDAGTQAEPGEGREASGQGEEASGVENGTQAGGNGSGAGTGTLRSRGDSDQDDFRSRQVHVPSDEFEQPEILHGQQTVDGPDGEAVVDYREVLTEYRQRATEAMASRYVPPSLKDLVRDYFSSLDAAQ